MALDAAQIRTSVEGCWDRDVLGPLQDYVRIPNVSPAFDPDWAANGHMAAATELVRRWCASRPVDGMRVEVLEVEGRTPVALCEIPATDPELRAAVDEASAAGSNAQGPNEFLHLPMARRISAAVSHVLDAHARR